MRTCPQCSKSIEHKHPNARFCGLRCKDRYHNKHNPRGFGLQRERDIDDDTHPQDPDALGQWCD
jgi:endogenous inhibitor of DNA gyrase (YacG/DUF329 family)